jgi:hypothetical protein
MHGSATYPAKRGMTAARAGSPNVKSSLVRRLVAAENDPAKQRIRAWLADLDDEHLLGFGLTWDEIAALRAS